MQNLPYDDSNMSGVPIDEKRGASMAVRGGRMFYPMDPRADEVFLEDISYALSRINRFGGYADENVSVAQHLLQCQWMAHMEGYGVRTQYAVLMHDAAEAYIGDMIRPVKLYMKDFKEVERQITIAINTQLEVPSVDHVVIKRFDNFGWAWEKRDCFKSAGEWPDTPELPHFLYRMKSQPTKVIEHMFIHRAVALRSACSIMSQSFGEENKLERYDTIRHTDERDWRDL